MIKIKDHELKKFIAYIHDVSGISFDSSKKYLIEMRLNKVLEEFSYKSYEELYHNVVNDRSKNIEKSIINAITINETLFFRDTSPFRLLEEKILPEIAKERSSNTLLNTNRAQKPLRIWSTACSTGQEVYSIAITLKKAHQAARNFSVKLIGTDISDSALCQAKSGKYNNFEIERGLDHTTLSKYFTASGGQWQVNPELRAMAEFKKCNIMKSFVYFGKFDIIFCRNVAIYFTPEDRKKLFNRLADSLSENGYLIIGSTESLTGISDRFIPKRHNNLIYYQHNKQKKTSV